MAVAERLAKMTGENRLMFAPVLEALLIRGLADRMTDTFRARLLALGINLEKLLPGYPYALWETAVLEAVTLLPELARERRWRISVVAWSPPPSTRAPSASY